MPAYLQKKIYLPLVDQKGEVIGSEERWKIHRQGLLHKGFSVALLYQGKLLLQYRRHPVFDKTTDVTASSHPLFENGKMQIETAAVYETLHREWGIDKSTVTNLKDLGGFVYRASDAAGYIEHEFCNLYQGEIAKLPVPNAEFAYGWELIEPTALKNYQGQYPLSPWVKASLSLLI